MSMDAARKICAGRGTVLLLRAVLLRARRPGRSAPRARHAAASAAAAAERALQAARSGCQRLLRPKKIEGFQGCSGHERHVFGPLGVNPLVERHAHCVLLAQRAVEDGLHAAVRADLQGGRSTEQRGSQGGCQARESSTGGQPRSAARRPQPLALHRPSARRCRLVAPTGSIPNQQMRRLPTHRLPDAPAAAPLSPQLDRPEPAHVVGVVEHEAHHRLGFVHLQAGG